MTRPAHEFKTYHLATRTAGDRPILEPSPALNDAILGILGRALYIHAVELHAFVFEPSGMRFLLTSPHRCSDFIGYLKSNLTRVAGNHLNWEGALWRRSFEEEEVATEARSLELLFGLLDDGDGEYGARLPSSTVSILSGMPMFGMWSERGPQEEGATPAAESHARVTPYLVSLAPLPSWRSMSPYVRAHHAGDFLEQRRRAAPAGLH
jgi:hypothetical protein